jgi:hypothetical protein
MIVGLYLTKYLSRYIYKLNIIESLFLRRANLTAVQKNTQKEDRKLSQISRGTISGIEYSKLEKKLEAKKPLRKTNVINMVDVMC